MASVIVRNLKDNTKIKLQNRAKRNGHSLEAELRIVLDEAVANENVPIEGFGTRFAKAFASFNLTEADFEPAQRHTQREPIDFTQ
jgi:plasmid stability protein